MAKAAGRTAVVKIGGTAIAGVRTKSISRNMTPIDVTTDDDAAFTTFIAGVMSEDTMEISVSGVEDGTVLRDAAMSADPADQHFSDLTFEFSGTPVDIISGNFIMTTYTNGNDYKEGTTFEATFVRNGEHTYAPGT